MKEKNRQFLHEQLYRKEFEKLRDKTVVIAGCGAIGSWAAEILARMGVQRFRLIDKDRVEPWNVSTQMFLPANIGQSKVGVVQHQLYRISKARVERQIIELTEANAGALLANADLVICSFDNKKSKLAVKSSCLQKDVPCVFAAMNGEEYYYEVIWAENYTPPDDPSVLELDPCNYPLATTLVVLASATTAEIATEFLLQGKKKSSRTNLGGILE